jgi:hypothetical protein
MMMMKRLLIIPKKFFLLFILLSMLLPTSKAQVGAALAFDGVDDYVDLGNSPYLYGSNSSITVELWVYMSSWVNGQTIMQNTSSFTTVIVYGGYEISTASGNLNAYLHRNGTFGVVSTPLSGISSGWHHIALTFDGRYTKLYVDAVLKSTDDALGTYSMYTSNTCNTLLGKSGGMSAGGGAGGYFQGKMDQLRIWYSCRTQCQISNYKNLDSWPVEPGLTPYWDCLENYTFNHGYGNLTNTGVINLDNNSPYGAPSGTLSNFALSGTTSNWVLPGAVTSGSTSVLSINQNTTPCVGGSTTLTASGATSYTWNTGFIGASLAIPSLSVGVSYTVSATLANGCIFGQVVNPNYHAPYLSITPNNPTICSGETLTLTASGAATYTWSNGSNNTSITPTPNGNGTRSVTGTDSFGCSSGPWSSAIVSISVNPTPTLSIATSGSVSCSAGNVTLTASGATSYTWSNNSTTLSTSNPWVISPSSNITRTVTGETNGCFDTAIQSIIVSPSPTVLIAPSTTVICSGQSVTLTASGANTYTWSGGPTNAVYVVSPTITTSYTVTGKTTATGCTDIAVITISINASPNVTITPSSTVICSVNTITLTAGGASTYTWSNSLGNNASVTLSPNSNVSRSVIGTAANGCTAQAVQSISVNTSPVVTTTTSGSPICSGQPATLTASGATTYTWNGVATGSVYVVTPSVTTNYTVIGTTNACTDQATRNISVNASPTVIIVPSSTVNCSANTVTLTASGAITYTWSNSMGNSAMVTLSPNSNFTRTVTGTAANGCTNQAVQSISVNTSPTVGIAQSSTVICSGKSATLTASGANTYTWTSGPVSAANVVSPSSTTIYTVTGETTASGCTDMATISLSVNASPTVTIVPSSTVICSANNVTLTAGGASTYTWSNSLGTTTVVTTSPNSNFTRTVTGTAVNGCTNQAVQSISVNTSPTVNVTQSSTVICSGKLATLTASGANTYTWTSGPVSAANVVSPSSTTIYTVTGETTASGCTDMATINLSVNASPTVTVIPSSTVICSANNVTLTAGGASTYTWSNSLGNATVVTTGLNANFTRTVTGSAANGCTNQAVQTISVNTTPTITITPSNTVICSGKTATFTASGANTYVWSGGPSLATYTLNASTTANYTVIGTNSTGGCTNTAVQNLSVNVTPTINIAASSTVICTGKTTTLTAGGADNYVWSGGPPTAAYAMIPFSTAIYTVVGTIAASGCTNSAVQTVSVNTTPVVTISPSSTVICTGNSATLTAGGASSYVWTSGPSTSVYTMSPISTADYTVTGTNGAGGCTNTAVQTISVNITPTISIAASSTIICAGSSATLTASGANFHAWAGGPFTTTYVVNPTSLTAYTVTGTNSVGGCTNTAMQSISVNTTPTLSIVATSTVFCSGNSTTLTASGASSYSWTNGPSTASNAVSPISTTNYTVIGTNGTCAGSAVQTVSVNTTPTINIAASSTVFCSGNTNATLTATGANSYVWTGGPSNAVYTLTPTSTAIYTVTGTNTLGGCSNTAVETLSINITPTLSIASSGTVFCIGNTATLTASGAGSYVWTGGPSTAVYAVTPSATAVYTVIGTNALGGCTNTAVQSVSVNPLPVIAISGNTVLCSGETTTLTGSGAASYTWTNGPSVAANTVTPLANTSYTLTGEVNNCINSETISVTVNANPTLTVNNGTVCAGASFTLFAGGASSYTWSTGATNSSVIVSPSASAVYTVVGTNTNNCSNSNTASVTITNGVFVNIMASASSICPGESVTLTATGANNYTWSTSSTNSVIVVSPVSASSYSVLGSSGASCSNTANQSISVNPIPVIGVVGTNFACANTPQILSAFGAVSYSWTNGQNTASILVTPTATTIYTVIGSNAFNCVGTGTFELKTPTVITPSLCLVTVDSASINNEIYWEKSLYPQADTFFVLRNTSGNNYSIIATIPKTGLSSYVDTNRATGLFNGNPNLTSYKYKLQYRDSCGNLSTMSGYHESIFIQDNQTGNFTWNQYFIEGFGPVTSVSYVLWRRNVLTSITTSVGASGGTALTDPLYPIISAYGNVKWYVSMSGFDCDPSQRLSSTTAATIGTTKSNNSNEKQFPLVTTGIEYNKFAANYMKIYPNPVENMLTLDFGTIGVNFQLEIKDVAGRIVKTDDLIGNKFYLSTRDFNNGIYFLTLYDKDVLIKTEKIIVQH